ncbi:LacI family DNA-binding transcriptional regulator [Paenibacillus sp. y28]|uniref:LacI family DNA-binding transcriptional regulator n=1 Tax=Paenibacillus sp. y28 TaxID=3129110 RepID=UPI003015C2C7
MSCIASRKEVADLAGVSEATVSRVLNGVGPIKEETRQKVQEAARSLGYVPSALAQSFARKRSGNLGVVLPYVPKVHMFSTYFFSEVLSGIGSKAREMGYDLLMLFRAPDEVMDYERLFHMQKVDACVILGSRDIPGEREALRQLAVSRRPFCLINQHYEGEAFNEIDAAHVEGSYEAVRHLLDQGHRRIAFLNGPQEYSNSGERLEGYRRALASEGIVMEERLLLTGNFSRTSGRAAAVALLPMLDTVDAVFAANDRMAIGLLQGLREQGVTPARLPAIVGYDDSDAARVTEPALSSVQVPFYDMGELAASKVLERTEEEGAAEPFRLLLPTRLVLRASSVPGGAAE